MLTPNPVVSGTILSSKTPKSDFEDMSLKKMPCSSETKRIVFFFSTLVNSYSDLCSPNGSSLKLLLKMAKNHNFTM